MCSNWNSWEGSDSDGWADDDAWSPELSFGDADAWRGEDAHQDSEAWRGTIHLEDWPVWNAGPEYHMWKRRAENE
jgi:hypothetical protein